MWTFPRNNNNKLITLSGPQTLFLKSARLYPSAHNIMHLEEFSIQNDVLLSLWELWYCCYFTHSYFKLNNFLPSCYFVEIVKRILFCVGLPSFSGRIFLLDNDPVIFTNWSSADSPLKHRWYVSHTIIIHKSES